MNKDYTITAEITVPEGGAEGMIVTLGRSLRRLRPVPAQGQAGLRLQPARPGALPLGGRRRRTVGEDFLGQALKPGKHTLVFDFKYDGPGPGKGGTGVFTVDGKELANKTIEHSIPLHDDHRRDLRHRHAIPARGWMTATSCRSRFTGTIDKLTFKLGPSQMAAADQRTSKEALARATD